MKDVNLNLSFDTIKQNSFSFLHRFHVVIFVIVVLGGVAAGIFALNTIIIRSSDTTDAPSASNGTTFDQATIKRIDELKTRDQSGGGLSFPPGRTNPFVE